MHNSASIQQILHDDLCFTDKYRFETDLISARKVSISQSFLKKFQDEIDADSANARCLELFKSFNALCKDRVCLPGTDLQQQVLGEVKNLFWHYATDERSESLFSFEYILDNCANGPGASLGASSDNFYSKMFDSTLTFTSDRLYRFFRYSISSSPTWLSAEKARGQCYGERMVSGNRLSFVPKTSEISRSICTEPLLNMFFQKGLGSALECVLSRFYKIEMSKQPAINRRMARRGSIDGTFGTIDLSSASDSIALSVLRQILPYEILYWIDLSRSPRVTFPDGTSEELYMVGSMGNGFVFPLQTLLFSTIVVACYRVLGIAPRGGISNRANWGVFGDDIIVLSQAFDFVREALKMFGFTVNDQKSFNAGCFRESCGGDYFKGHDVRGVYCKSLSTRADIYSTVNRLIRWSSRTGIMLPRLVSYLLKQVPFLPVPWDESDVSGIKVPYSRSGLFRRGRGLYYYRALTLPKKILRLPWNGGRTQLPKHVRRSKASFNADGLLVTAVGGFTRDGVIYSRFQAAKDNAKIRIISAHDWDPPYPLNLSVRNRIDSICGVKSPSDAGDSVGFVSPDNSWETVVELYLC